MSFFGLGCRVAAVVGLSFAAVSTASALPLVSYPSTISFSGGGGGANGSVLTFSGPTWTGLDFYNATGNAIVTKPPYGQGPTGALSGSTGDATFSDTSFLTPGALFSTADGFVFSWNSVTTNYLGNGSYSAQFVGTISKAGVYDATPFAFSFSTQPSATGEPVGLSWSGQGAVVSLPGTLALLGLGLAATGVAVRRGRTSV